ncbi:MAG: DUF4238 domain-containing protein [Chitinophagaceae bacterium]|nr:DUF4238 domain-containing protein [Chitinophagaceae bacterium]
MTIQITEKQHFVPRTYLKHFAEKKGSAHYNIIVTPKNNLNAEAIFERNTKSICYQKHLYTQPGSTAEEKMLLETFYSQALEDKYQQIYALLVDPDKNELTEEERELVISTVATMFYRVPNWTKKHTGFIKRVFVMSIQATAHTGQKETVIEGDKYIIEGKTVDQLTVEYIVNNKAKQVISQLKAALGLIRIRLQNDNIYIFKLEEGDQEFITSDNPVVLQNPHKQEILPFDPTNIMKLPLDNKHYLMLLPNDNKDNLNRITRNKVTGGFSRREELISNTEQLQNADEYILGNTLSLVRFLAMKDQDIVLTKEEQEFEKQLFALGKQNGWIK